MMPLRTTIRIERLFDSSHHPRWSVNAKSVRHEPADFGALQHFCGYAPKDAFGE